MIPGLEDPLEKEVATHSSILAWEIPWTEELGRPQSMGSQRDMTEGPTIGFFLISIFIYLAALGLSCSS